MLREWPHARWRARIRAPTSFADRRITSTKFSNSDPPRVRFISDNPLYKPYEGSGEEVNIIGRTVGSPGKCEPSSNDSALAAQVLFLNVADFTAADFEAMVPR